MNVMSLWLISSQSQMWSLPTFRPSQLKFRLPQLLKWWKIGSVHSKIIHTLTTALEQVYLHSLLSLFTQLLSEDLISFVCWRQQKGYKIREDLHWNRIELQWHQWMFRPSSCKDMKLKWLQPSSCIFAEIEMTLGWNIHQMTIRKRIGP